MNPKVKLDCWDEQGNSDEVTLEVTRATGVDTLEVYVLITPPEGKPFMVRVNEMMAALSLIDNAGDELVSPMVGVKP